MISPSISHGVHDVFIFLLLAEKSFFQFEMAWLEAGDASRPITWRINRIRGREQPISDLRFSGHVFSARDVQSRRM